MNIFSAVTNHDFSDNTCFLCGASLTSNNRSDEHVFPKWLQSRYDLWNEKISLLNGTLIPYRQLTIPCCSDCNNNKLSQIEAKVQSAIENGYTAVKSLDSKTLFIWLGKIFYGMLYRELFLPLNRSSPSSNNIISPEDMERFQMHHYFLQSCRVPMQFRSFDAVHPWTIYVFQLQDGENYATSWDFRDDIINETICIKLVNIGMLAAFDCGAIFVDAGDKFSKYSNYSLHPLQFYELGAAFFYKASLLNRVPKFIISEAPNQFIVTIMPMAGMSEKPVFDEWMISDYAQHLSAFTQCPVEELHPSPEKITTWLRKQNSDEFMHIDLNGDS